MAKHYDNLEDVKGKLAGTIIYYGGTPVYVKSAYQDEETSEFTLQITGGLTARNTKMVKLDDKDLNWTKFNIGYTNEPGVGSVWWYRQPVKQYCQGLKSNQMRYRLSEKTPNLGFEFRANKSTEAMLLSQYPDLPTVEQTLKDKQADVVAFHKDFALSWDKIHKDFIIEHKGRLVGCMAPNFQGIRLSEEYEYLHETVREVINAR